MFRGMTASMTFPNSKFRQLASLFSKNAFTTYKGSRPSLSLKGRALPQQTGKMGKRGKGAWETNEKSAHVIKYFTLLPAMVVSFWAGKESGRFRSQSCLKFLASAFAAPTVSPTDSMGSAAGAAVSSIEDKTTDSMGSAGAVSSSEDKTTDSMGSAGAVSSTEDEKSTPVVNAKISIPGHLSVRECLQEEGLPSKLQKEMVEYRRSVGKGVMFYTAMQSPICQEALKSQEDEQLQQIAGRKFSVSDAQAFLIKGGKEARDRAIFISCTFETCLMSLCEDLQQRLEEAVKSHPPTDMNMSLREFIEQGWIDSKKRQEFQSRLDRLDFCLSLFPKVDDLV